MSFLAEAALRSYKSAAAEEGPRVGWTTHVWVGWFHTMFVVVGNTQHNFPGIGNVGATVTLVT